MHSSVAMITLLATVQSFLTQPDGRIVDCLDAYLYYGFMPRPKSDEKRSAILEAATRIIVAQGLSAPTAGIAKEAGVANGSLFTYFETKTDLFNQLYLELKTEMASAAMRSEEHTSELQSHLNIV